MIRSLLELLLSRSLDERTSPPRWLQSIAQRDSRLSEFASSSAKLDTALQTAAAERREAMTANDVPTLKLPQHRRPSFGEPSRAARRSRSWSWVFAAAAVLIVAVLPTRLRPSRPAVDAGDFSQQLTVVPGEVLRLLTQAAETSQTKLPELSPLNQLSVPKLATWDKLATNVGSPVRRELDSWEASWQSLKSRLGGAEQEL